MAQRENEGKIKQGRLTQCTSTVEKLLSTIFDNVEKVTKDRVRQEMALKTHS